jgi:hypothetical protein
MGPRSGSRGAGHGAAQGSDPNIAAVGLRRAPRRGLGTRARGPEDRPSGARARSPGARPKEGRGATHSDLLGLQVRPQPLAHRSFSVVRHCGTAAVYGRVAQHTSTESRRRLLLLVEAARWQMAVAGGRAFPTRLDGPLCPGQISGGCLGGAAWRRIFGRCHLGESCASSNWP